MVVGLFLATLLWFGWDGGTVGESIGDGLHGAFGAAAYAIPLVLIVVGGLMLVRSKLVDLKPFRTGLVVGAFGLMIALGRDEGGAIGGAVGGGVAHVIGRPSHSSSESACSSPARCSSRVRLRDPFCVARARPCGRREGPRAARSTRETREPLAG